MDYGKDAGMQALGATVNGVLSDLLDLASAGKVPGSTEDPTLFTRIMKAAMAATFDLDQLPDDLGLTRGAYERWKSGETVPHPALQRRVFDYLRERLNEAKQTA